MDQQASMTNSLAHACLLGDLDMVESMLRDQADPNHTVSISYEGIDAITHPLVAAATFGAASSAPDPERYDLSLRMLRLLVDAGSDMQSVETAVLGVLTSSGNSLALDFALSSGARIHNPFHLASVAISRARVDSLAVLRSWRIDPNVTDGHGNTALHNICSSHLPFFRDSAWGQHCDSSAWYATHFRSLAAVGLDLNRRDGVGSTPLMRAVVARQMDIARALIAAGADVNHRMRNGVSAVHLAVSHSNHSLVSTLLDQPIDRQDLLRMQIKRVQPDIKALLASRMRSSRTSTGRAPSGGERRLATSL